MNTLTVGIQNEGIVCDEYPLEGFEMMRRTGFSCCDFDLNPYIANALCYLSEGSDLFRQSVEELQCFFSPYKEAAETAGIRINQMHMPYLNCMPNVTAEINSYFVQTVVPKSMEICAFFGCSYIVVHGFGSAYSSDTEETAWEQAEKFLNVLAPLAKKYHITICMENIYADTGKNVMEGLCCDAGKAAAYIDQVNAEYGAEVLGFCFDTGHANLAGINMEDFVTTLGSRLKALHIHDNDGMNDLHQIPFTFTKNRESLPSTDWDGFIRGLQRIRFDGVLSFETAPVLSAFPAVMKQDVLRFIAQIGSYFAGEISRKTH